MAKRTDGWDPDDSSNQWLSGYRWAHEVARHETTSQRRASLRLLRPSSNFYKGMIAAYQDMLR